MRIILPALLLAVGAATVAAAQETPSMPAPDTLLKVPVTGVLPGIADPQPPPENPFKNDPDAAQRGYQDFLAFNCVGCHAPNGAGGMGPSLSNAHWIYRSHPANIYLSIAQGRAAGMPAFGTVLPPQTIWELVTYIQSISKEPGPTFGTVTSAAQNLPAREQVPAEFIDTVNPWQHTQPFSNGQKP